MKRQPMPPRKVSLAAGPVRLRRSPLSRSSSPRPARQTAPEATKAGKAPQGGIPQATKDLVAARSRGVCEAAIDGVCLGRATNIHHRRRRGVGPDPHNPVNLLHLCGSGTTGCHGHAHRHPTEAKDNGWIVRPEKDPAFEPVLIRGSLKWLTEAGRYVGEVDAA